MSLVYESIDDTKSYGDLQRASSSSSTTTTTPFFLEFVQWCVDEYRVGGLLEHALSHGRTREASMLVNMLHSKHPTSTLKKKWNDVVARGEHEMEGDICDAHVEHNKNNCAFKLVTHGERHQVPLKHYYHNRCKVVKSIFWRLLNAIPQVFIQEYAKTTHIVS